MKKLPLVVTLTIAAMAAGVLSSVPTDSIGEGSIFGYEPVPADTVRDTSFHVGDTLWLGEGRFCVKPDPARRVENIYPSVHTNLKIIAGDGFAHGQVTQTFYNPFDLPFNATYVFPLPHNGAVHGMEFISKLGAFKAVIREKALAESLFVQAQRQGQQAALLTQTQRSIFTQKLANIPPHDSIRVVITFSMALSYDMGTLELAFPTTIGHRYGAPPLAKRSTAATPVYVKPGARPANSLDFSILLCTPFEAAEVKCPNFPCTFTIDNVEALARTYGVIADSASLPANMKTRLIRLSGRDELPNRDIVVQFRRRSTARDAGVLSWHNGAEGYFALQLYPDLADTGGAPQAVDMVFVIDKSGSMNGPPMELTKKIVLAMLNRATPNDRISLLSFDNASYSLFEEPVAATAANVAQATTWVNTLTGTGGTEMLSAVRKALAVALPKGATRIMALITDGGIWGVDSMYTAIKKDGRTKAFAFGVGASPNRDLIDGAAVAGDGIGKNIGYNDDIDAVIADFWMRIRAPQLENITIDWGGETPSGLTKSTLGSMWLGQPLVLFGKYDQPGNRVITLSGTKAGNPVSQSFNVSFCQNNPLMYFVPCMWARQTIENLLYTQTLAGNEDNKSAIISLSSEFEVLCKYTAFLAIADSSVTDNPALSGKVPLLIPQATDPSLYAYDAASAGRIGAIQISKGFMEVREGDKGFIDNSKTASPDMPRLTAVSSRGQIRISISGSIPDIGVVLRIWDLRGKLIRTWRVNGPAAENLIWDLTTANGRRVGAGAFVLTLTGPAVNVAVPVVVK
jgi:Ca-activated chloride channel family protein